ncbi:MAG: transcription initiation factor IIB [Nitrososphaeraceae archaeon]
MKSQVIRHRASLYQNTVQIELPSHQKSIDKIVDVNRSISQQVCNSCKSMSVIFDEPKGETVCTDCGIVISEKHMTLEKGIESKDTTGMPSSLVYPDKGLNTVITNQNTDANGTSLSQDQISSVNKIRYYNKLSDSKNHIRNLKNAFAVMAVIKDKLNLTDAVIERAAYYYRKTLNSQLIKGRSIKEMVVASVYAACKEMDIPRRLEDISESVFADKIFAGRCFRIMTRELSINSPSVDAARYMSKVAENADVSQKTYRRAVNMLDVVKKDPISYGKDPKALATAALYGACMIEEKDKVNQARIAQAGGISVVTLRKRVLDISKVFPEIQNGK